MRCQMHHLILPAQVTSLKILLPTAGIDPEGDDITYLRESNLDGVLSNQSSWQGYLSRGSHVISLSVNDGRMEHVTQPVSLPRFWS